jgi:radical SAM superfamily enzyme YgiQ (UPF0313 family)
MVDVVLINPPMWSPAEHATFSSLCPPLGLGYLAACLLNRGASVEILDLNVTGAPLSSLDHVLREKAPRLVGVTTVTQNYFLARRVAHIARAALPDAFIVTGGPHVSYLSEQALDEPAFDAAALFEAEQTIVDLWEQLTRPQPDLYRVHGLAFRDGDRKIATPARPLEKNMDAIPYPARHLLPMALYGRPGTIMTSRGCPMKCIFCISSTYEGSYRPRSADNVLGELTDMREKWGIREAYFIDNVFTVNAQRVRNICKGMIERNIGMQFNCVSRADLVTEELIACMKAAGCIRIEIGVESAVQEIIDLVKKHIKVEQVERAADIVLGAGITPMFTFQIGSPFETPESLQKTHDLAAKLRGRGAMTFFSTMTPYPGTPLAAQADSLGIRIRTSDWTDYRTSNPVYDTPKMTRNEFRKALYRESLMHYEVSA